ncbi:MAG: response regulator [Oscillospiraceae bacterium]|nr:response regulator [Oscillospiraceae bacterium]
MYASKKNSVLIVDDETSNIIALTHILQPEYTIYVAKNGATAIAAAAKHLPDVILLDVIMSEMDGYDVITALKSSEITRGIPVIFITGLSDTADEEKGLALGAADYIAKPFSAARVKVRVLNQMKLIEQFRSNEYDIMKYKLANDALGIALWDMDVVSGDPINPNNRFTWSKEVRNMLGFKDESDFPNVLHSWSDRLHPEDREETLRAFAAHIKDGAGKTPYNIEYRLKAKTGEYRHFHALGTTSRDNTGTPLRVAGALMDITDKKQTEYEAKQRAEAEMLNRAKSAFLANMSHEIRTPMNAIWGVTEILMQNESLPEAIAEGLDRIHASCGLLLGIINDILDFSKIEAGKMDIMPAPYNVASLINDSAHLNMMRIGDKPIVFDILADENLPAKLVGDELRIKQILNNLLSNAFKYTDTGRVTLSAAAEPGKNDGITLALSVRDTGLGMTGEQVSRLFEEYSRFNEETDRATEGTGLGMAITYRLLNLMDGEIHVESEPGRGSLFTVRLPQGVAGDEVLGEELAEELKRFRGLNPMTQRKNVQLVHEPMPYGSVLIVDDVETNLYVAAGLMKPYGLQIETVLSGSAAIEKIKNGKTYDIVFMDHMMPEMDGIEVTKRLRGLGYGRPIVALTANAVAGQADMFLQNGFDAFISKPIDMRNLDSVLNKLVRDKQPADVIEAARRQAGSPKANGGAQIGPMLMESFIRDTRKAVAALENADLDGEEGLRAFTVTVHGIKSALANIGEKKLSETAQKLEAAGRENDTGFIESTVPGFLNGLRALLDKAGPEPDADGADGDAALLREQLLAIKDMCADYNRKGALEALETIRQKGCSKETRAVLDGVIELVMQSEFEEAENAVMKFTAELSAEEDQSTESPSIPDMEIEGLDIAKGLERFSNDAETYLKILHSYTVSIRSLLGMDEVIGEDTLAGYKIAAHSIKGTSLDIFAEPIGRKAAELEQAAKDGDLSYINSHNPAFLKSVRKLIRDIEDMLAAVSAKHKKPVKDKPDGDALSRLAEACETYSMDGADAAMAEIDRYQYDSDGGLADWLRDNVDKMNFPQIVEKLSGLNQ